MRNLAPENQHFLIGVQKQDQIIACGHRVFCSTPKEAPNKPSGSVLTIRIIPNGSYAGFFLDINKENLATLKKQVDKASKLAEKVPEEKAARLKPITAADKEKAKKKAAPKKAAVKKKAVKKKAVKKKAAK